MRFYQRCLRVLALLCCTLAPVGGCAIRRVATTAELDQLGTRKYSNHGRDEVIKATVTALRIQGYEVITTDPRIRTAPRDVATTALGNPIRLKASPRQSPGTSTSKATRAPRPFMQWRVPP